MLQKTLRIQPDSVLPETLDALVNWVINKSDPYSALALHPFVTDEFKQQIESILFANKRLKYVFATAQYTPETVLEVLASEPNDQLCVRLLKHPNTVAKTLERLYKSNNSTKLLMLIAAHPNTPGHVLKKIEWQGTDKIRAALCENRNTPLSVINKLLINSSLQEKKKIVKNPFLNKRILETLWNEGDEYLRAEIVAQSKCPKNLIVKAIKSRHRIERQKLASNPAIDDVIRYQLLIDDAAEVRAAIVRDQDISDDELQQLCADPSKQVRRNEARRNGLTALVIKQLSKDEDIWVRRWLARNAAASKNDLEKLAVDKDENVRRSVARNESCPRGLLNKLADDNSSWVRAGVALRTDISKKTLLRLIDDQDIDVQSAIGKNPMTPVKILKRIAENSDHDVRRSVILNEKISAKMLEIFIEDPYPLNRIILASQPRCSQKTLWRLANDPEQEIRFNAIRTFTMRMLKDNNYGV